MNWLVILLAAMLLWPSSVRADELRPGYLEFTEMRRDGADGVWHSAWKLPLAAPPVEMPAPPQLPANCHFAGTVRQGTTGSALVGNATAICRGPVGGGTIAMPDLSGPGDMLVRIQTLDQPVQALRLTATSPSAQIAARPGTMQLWRSYFVLGVGHILTGWDHLLFVIALVLLLRRWRAVAVAATAFTVAHSLTLGGAALGFLAMPQRPVEALIALSIVFLAVEITRLPGADYRPSLTARFPWVIAFLFGLVHGFGFAGALAQIGLPQGDIVAALLSFNLGVEAGQLLVIAAVLAALAALARNRFDLLGRPVIEPAVTLATYAIGITASYWLIGRVIA